MKPIAFAGLIVAVAPVPAAAQDWRALAYAGEGRDAAIVYVDVASVKRLTATTREMATARVFERVRTLPSGVNYNMNRHVYRVDCTAMTLAPLRTEVFALVPQPLFSVPAQGGAVRIDDTSAFAAAVRAACSGDFTPLKHRSGNDAVLNAGTRFRARSAVRTSFGSTNWHRLAAGGTAPQRMAYFVDRSSIVTEFSGERTVTTMLVLETPNNGIKRTHDRVRVDCTAQTRTEFYSALFDTGNMMIGGILASSAARLTPGTFLGLLSAPVCRSDWGIGRAFSQTPQAIVGSAFTP